MFCIRRALLSGCGNHLRKFKKLPSCKNWRICVQVRGQLRRLKPLAPLIPNTYICWLYNFRFLENGSSSGVEGVVRGVVMPKSNCGGGKNSFFGRSRRIQRSHSSQAVGAYLGGWQKKACRSAGGCSSAWARTGGGQKRNTK